MRKLSLAKAKAHISALVTEAEHRGRSTLILRHGKPAAAIVPVSKAILQTRQKPKAKPQALKESLLSFIEEFSSLEPGVSAIEDLIRGRR